MTTAETRPETGGRLHLTLHYPYTDFVVTVEYNTGESKILVTGSYDGGLQADAQLEWLVSGAAEHYGMSFIRHDEEENDDSGTETESSPTEGE